MSAMERSHQSLSLRQATVADVAHVAEWFANSEAVRLWGGPVIRYPLLLDTLIDDIDFLAQPSYALASRMEGLVAFGQIRPRSDFFHLARLAVAPLLRGRGLGKTLILALMQRYPEAPGFSLYVYRRNLAAFRCYSALGFEPTADPEGAKPGEDCEFMVYRGPRQWRRTEPRR